MTEPKSPSMSGLPAITSQLSKQLVFTLQGNNQKERMKRKQESTVYHYAWLLEGFQFFIAKLLQTVTTSIPGTYAKFASKITKKTIRGLGFTASN